ncbi:ATP-binding protein [Legionella parisiensis]|uniref:histidine kinase n=1 Tax=Legionella parisiensis TaxID=45071 RepID=A0A1E5JWL6_9GAMM|nr:ATP-binding protein [Legionella parisiensis]KTD42245.1 sensor histidine kinase CpxA [Legionella parisiensis]OEH48916.1 Sensor protein RstB [Legionella parisiensis]STX72312.1 Sensor protein [Legionella parisiensis]
MIKLYLKTISASLLILFLVLLGFYLFFTHSIRIMSQKTQDILGTGNFSVLEHIVLQSNTWNRSISKSNEELKKLFPQNIDAVQVIDMNSIPFTDKEKEQLLTGSIVYKDAKNRMFLTYSIHDVYAYKQINKSSYVLKVQMGASINDMVKGATYLMRTLILNALKTVPMNQWEETLAKLQLQYQIPLTLTSINNKNISPVAKNNLIDNEVVYDIPTDEKPITTVYFKIPGSDQIITVGPLHYPYFSLRLSEIQIYFVITITFLTIFAVAVLTWLFSRNSAKIYRLTQEYSQGHFNYDVQLNRISTLRSVYENVVAMGNKINVLMQSQQNMARFVAHELRTPLYTIQLALDSLKKLKAQSGEEQEHIESIEEDMQELNQLIHTFLLYSQSTTRELKINEKLLNLRLWLESLLKTHQSYEINVLFNYQQSNNEFLYFDPKLLYHAVTNLISNALKHAHKEILISLEYQNESVIIRIDDDGPGVPECDREKIVEPFTTLNASDTKGKHIGLGLSITKSILSLHGGMLAINEAKTLKGASFSLILPRIT